MAELIDTMKFKSPINLDSSFGMRPLAKRATSVMRLHYNQDDSGFIEWEVPRLDLYEEIGLTFTFDRNGQRTLTDYDGVFAIPDQALDLLERNGVDVAEMRKAMAD